MSSKIVSIHQPHFFPWLGYFDKIISSDFFVFLDNVQFEKNYFQNRTLIKSSLDAKVWFGIPVKKAPLATPINEIIVAEVYNPKNLVATLKQYYRKAPFLNNYYPEIEDILCSGDTNLSSINIRSVRFILELLELDIKVFLSSELAVESQDSNIRLLEICSAVGANKYLSGVGGRKYIKQNLFTESQIDLLWQDFDTAEITYPQIGANFVPGLSVIDVLMNVGKDGLKSILKVI